MTRRAQHRAPAAEGAKFSEVVVVMPAYNEAGCIEAVVREWVDAVGRMVVVNDGSRDETGRILDRLAGELPMLEVIHQQNAGHGAALLAGYRAALATGAPWIFQTDSDGQFLASDFSLLWQRHEESDFLMGRRRNRDDHPIRIWLSRLHAHLLYLLFGVSLSDPNVPYRLIRASVLASYLKHIPAGTFAPNVMLTILAARDGHNLGFIPVEHRARQTGVVSIRGWKTLQVGRLVFGQLLAFRRALPARIAPVRTAATRPSLAASLAAVPHAMRVPHWLKNGLVLAPLLFSRSFHDAGAVAAALWAALAFSLLASAVYLWNDLRDVAADRNHVNKRLRPLASGTLPAGFAPPLAAGLSLATVLVLFRIPEAWPFALVYAAINVGYSAGLKHVPWLDLLLLTAGYVLRVLAGAAVIHVQPTLWMLSATFALALYLAALKRFAELTIHGTGARAALAHYQPGPLRAVALTAGAAAVGCYALFTVWVRPALLPTLPAAVAGVLRYGWMVLHRRGGDSPFLLLARDPWLVLSIALWLAGIVYGLW